jgi:hypothetical protein
MSLVIESSCIDPSADPRELIAHEHVDDAPPAHDRPHDDPAFFLGVDLADGDGVAAERVSS